jgi:hypothetical protein
VDELVTEVVDRLTRARSWPWLRVIADARLDQPVEVDTDPAAVVAPYRWLLAAVGGGVTLTQAGYLPPAMVERAMSELDWESQWPGKHNREDLTLPILELRESAQRFGLVRKYKGRLLTTAAARKVADDPQALWWYLANRLPDARSESQRHAGVAFLLLVAAGRARDDSLLAEALAVFGWVDRMTGDRVGASGAFSAARDTWALFRRLGLLAEKARWDDPEPPPTEAARRLARAALIGAAVSTPETGPVLRLVGGKTDQAVQLTITLRHITPPIWRRIVVPASLTLRELHAVIQTAMGWEDYHLHLFEIDGVLYGDIEDFQGQPLGEEDTFTVGQTATAVTEFRYEYDFGDSWEHDVVVDHIVDSVGEDTPRLVDGARACPPEDCGGWPGYDELVEVLADPTHEEYAGRIGWLGGGWDPDAFDLAATNDILAMYDRATRQRRRGT